MEASYQAVVQCVLKVEKEYYQGKVASIKIVSINKSQRTPSLVNYMAMVEVILIKTSELIKTIYLPLEVPLINNKILQSGLEIKQDLQDYQVGMDLLNMQRWEGSEVESEGEWVVMVLKILIITTIKKTVKEDKAVLGHLAVE